LCALRPPRVNKNRERLWKLGLVGGLVSASLQIAIGTPPLLGRIEWRPEPKLVERTELERGTESMPPGRSLDAAAAPVEKSRPRLQQPFVSSGASGQDLASSPPAPASTVAPRSETPAAKASPVPEAQSTVSPPRAEGALTSGGAEPVSVRSAGDASRPSSASVATKLQLSTRWPG